MTEKIRPDTYSFEESRLCHCWVAVSPEMLDDESKTVARLLGKYNEYSSSNRSINVFVVIYCSVENYEYIYTAALSQNYLLGKGILAIS